MLNQSLKALELDDDKRYAILISGLVYINLWEPHFTKKVISFISQQMLSLKIPEYHLPDRGIFEGVETIIHA